MSLDPFSSGQSLIGVERAFRRIMLYCWGRTLCHGEVRYPKCILVQADLGQFCTFLGTILQDVWVISLSWPRLNIYTLVVTCVPLILQIFWMPVENSKSALSVLGSVLLFSQPPRTTHYLGNCYLFTGLTKDWSVRIFTTHCFLYLCCRKILKLIHSLLCFGADRIGVFYNRSMSYSWYLPELCQSSSDISLPFLGPCWLICQCNSNFINCWVYSWL